MMRGSPAVLGGFSALFGFFTNLTLLGIILLPYSSSSEPNPGIPISVNVLMLFYFIGPPIGMVGAWELSKHRKAGSIGMLFAGLLPITVLLVVILQSLAGSVLRPPGFDYGFVALNILFYLWWPLLVVLAGVLGLLNLPSRLVKEDLGEDFSRGESASI